MLKNRRLNLREKINQNNNLESPSKLMLYMGVCSNGGIKGKIIENEYRSLRQMGQLRYNNFWRNEKLVNELTNPVQVQSPESISKNRID